jgi:L-malate glycosyltransferase
MPGDPTTMIVTLKTEASCSNLSAHADLSRVLIVIDQLSKTLGGGERVVLRLANLLPHYGYSPSILTFSADPESPALQASPCPIYLLPLARTYDFKAIRAAFELRRFLVTQRIKIVQTFFESSDLWAGFVTKAMSPAKLIWSRRDMGILRTSKHRIAYKLMNGVPDAVFAVSEEVRQYCIDVDGIQAGRVQTIYNGLNLSDWSAASPRSNESGELSITTVGNIRRVKGHDIFVKAAGMLASRFPHATFSIAGEVLDQDYFSELQSLVKEANLLGRFHFAGGVADMQKHLSEANIFVLPSRSEGFSNAIVEAMAASLPVVATNVGGNAEAIEDGVTGFIVPPEDPEALSEAIARLLSDPTLSSVMGMAGRSRVARKFTIEAMLDQTTATYRSLLNPAS